MGPGRVSWETLLKVPDARPSRLPLEASAVLLSVAKRPDRTSRSVAGIQGVQDEDADEEHGRHDSNGGSTVSWASKSSSSVPRTQCGQAEGEDANEQRCRCEGEQGDRSDGANGKGQSEPRGGPTPPSPTRRRRGWLNGRRQGKGQDHQGDWATINSTPWTRPKVPTLMRPLRIGSRPARSTPTATSDTDRAALVPWRRSRRRPGSLTAAS